MGQVIITANITLDGVVQDPDGEEGFSRGGWFARHGGADLQEWASIEQAEAEGASALLLGASSDRWFAERWLPRQGAFADRLNSMPRYVLSSRLAEPAWTGATMLRGDLVSEVSALKRQVSGEIVVYGSCRLGRSLIRHDLADELRLFVFPVVAGDGARLFPPTSAARGLRLAHSRSLGANVVFLRYQRQDG